MIIKWLHFSDLHLNNDEAETLLMRNELPKFLIKNNIKCDYAFCTGDIRNAPDGGYPENSSDYIKELCNAVNVPIDNLFVVPGNHDIERDLKKRNNAISNIGKYYTTRSGKINDSDLIDIYSGKEIFLSFLEELYGNTSDRLAFYRNALNPHFVITTEHFNILHIDSTLTYSNNKNRDFVLGTKLLIDALNDADKAKPTILISHYTIEYLTQDEKEFVSELLYKNNVKLWLAGHEHTHNLKPHKYIDSIQAGELRIEERSKATVLVGEYDTEIDSGFIKAYSWFSEGWAEYPIIWHSYAEENKFPFSLWVNRKNLSREVELCKQSNEQYRQNDIIRSLLPDLICENIIYDGNSPLITLMDAVWKRNKNILIFADGGMGKTTMLLDVVEQKSEDAVLYIPLEQLDAYGLTIKQHINRKLFDGTSDTQRLYGFTSSYNSKPKLILLLDGFNEISGNSQQKFVNEIRELSEYPGIQIVVTSRENFTGRFKLPFKVVEVELLSYEKIQRVLDKETWNNIIRESKLVEILRSPMLLLMYNEICPIMKNHRESFLDWIIPMENATQLIHNYFVAQEVILLDQKSFSAEKFINTLKCIRYALPYIGYCFERDNRFSVSRELFNKIIEQAIDFSSQFSYLDKEIEIVQEKYRVAILPKIDKYTLKDVLINVSGIITNENDSYSFKHQIYRDFMSSSWIVNMSKNRTIDIWNCRKIPGYLFEYVRVLSGTYWEGIAKDIANFARGKSCSDIHNLLYNLLNVYPYTNTSGTPDFSELDLRETRLCDYVTELGAIPMCNTQICKKTLSLTDEKTVLINRLKFSPDGLWLVGMADETINIWSMQTGELNMELDTECCYSSFYFLKNDGYMLSFSPNGYVNILGVYKLSDNKWGYCCGIEGVINDTTKFLVVFEGKLYVYYNNRLKCFSLTDGRLLKTISEKSQCQNLIKGEIINFKFLNKKSKSDKNSDDTSICCAVCKNKGLRACSYSDGSLRVFANNEIYYDLLRGNAILKAAAISDDGKRAVTLSQKKYGNYRKMQLWDLETKKRIEERTVPQETVNVHLTSAGKWIICEMTKHYFAVAWDNDSNHFVIHEKLISDQHDRLSSYDSKMLCISENDLKLFDLDTRSLSSVNSRIKDVRLATFLPDGQLVVVGRKNNKAVFKSTRDGSLLEINSESALITGIYCLKGEPFICLSTSNGMLSVYHTGTKQRTRKLVPEFGNSIIAGHKNKYVIACSGGKRKFGTYYYHTYEIYGKERGVWREYKSDFKSNGKVLDMNFNESNSELVTIFSDGNIVYSDEINCDYKSNTRIITNFNVDVYNFKDIICNDEVKQILLSNGA